MSFRRDGGKAHEWQHWLREHRAALVRAGIPDSVLRDKRHWLVFIQEGGWDPESGFDVDALSPEQARELRDLLLREYGDDVSGGILIHLERRISN